MCASYKLKTAISIIVQEIRACMFAMMKFAKKFLSSQYYVFCHILEFTDSMFAIIQ